MLDNRFNQTVNAPRRGRAFYTTPRTHLRRQDESPFYATAVRPIRHHVGRPCWTLPTNRFRWVAGSFIYCFSYTIVALYAFPSALVPLSVLVVVFPSFETTLRPETLYFPPFFFCVKVNVFAFTCLMAMVSYGDPVTGYSFPSYFAV